jgi:hypothetical protein
MLEARFCSVWSLAKHTLSFCAAECLNFCEIWKENTKALCLYVLNDK